VLSGFGGDELLFERGIFRDLAARGRWLELLRQARLAPRYSTHSSAFYIQDALRALVPRHVRRLYRRLRPRTLPTPPCWLGPELQGIYQCEGGEPVAPAYWEGASHTQQFTWRWLTSPNLWWSIELQAYRAARQGVELRLPFLDRRLADFVMSIPYEQRLPAGQMKRLLRAGMGRLLPPEIARRARPTTFDAMVRLHFQKHHNYLEKLFSDGNSWLSKRFVDQSGIKKFFQELDTASLTSVGYSSIQLVLDVGQLERWLDGLSRDRLLTSTENLQ
jgi:asparagine synthetase B (glutamine-hydrolysing)